MDKSRYVPPPELSGILCRSIVSSCNPFVLCDSGGTVLYADPSFLERRGYGDPGSVEGKPLAKFCMPRGGTGDLLSGVSPGESRETETTGAGKDGSTFRTTVPVSAVAGENDPVEDFSLIFANTSEDVKGERPRREDASDRRILEDMGDAVFVLDRGGRVRHANGSGYELMGTGGAGVHTDTPFEELWEEGCRRAAAEAVEDALGGKVCPVPGCRGNGHGRGGMVGRIRLPHAGHGRRGGEHRRSGAT